MLIDYTKLSDVKLAHVNNLVSLPNMVALN